MKMAWHLLKNLRNHIMLTLGSVLLGVTAVISSISLLTTSAFLIAQAALHPSIAELQVAIVGVRFFGLSRAVLRYLERLTSHAVNLRLLGELQRWLYRILVPLAPARLYSLRAGDLLSRSIGDIEALENFYVRFAFPLVVAVLTISGIALFAITLHPVFALILFAGMAIVGGLIPLVTYTLQHKSLARAVNLRADLSALIADFIQGQEDLRAFGRDRGFAAEIQRVSQDYTRTQIQIARRNGLMNGLAITGTLLTVWVVLWVGTDLVANHHLEGVFLAVVVVLALAGFEAVNPLVQGAQGLESALQAARRLLALQDLTPAVSESNVPKPLPPTPNLEFRNLTFHYPEDRHPTLQDICLSLPYGKRLALLGPSGSGKSTLVSLLLRFWDYKEGEILLDGVPLREFDSNELRHLLGVLEQRPYLFSDTVRNNLLLGAPEATEPDLWWALEQVDLEAWVRNLPQGLDTWIGNLGVQISGGEGQRLALARLFLTQAPIVIVDEPTTHLDNILAARITHRLFKHLKQRTLLWITHTPYGLEQMDEIVVLHRGSIIERGSHEDLLAQKGFYAAMWAMHQQRLPEKNLPEDAGRVE